VSFLLDIYDTCRTMSLHRIVCIPVIPILYYKHGPQKHQFNRLI